MSALSLAPYRRWSFALAAICVAAAATAVVGYRARNDVSQVFRIESSYAFDVTNLPYLAGYADNVFLARVVAVDGVQEPHTVYRVQVDDVLKGSLSGEVAVAQLGNRSGNDVWVEEEQPLLEVGSRYLLVTNPRIGSDVEVVLGGPAASVNLDHASQTGTSDLLDDYRQAIKADVYPPGVPPKD